MAIQQDLRAVADVLADDVSAIADEILRRVRSGAPNYDGRGDPMLRGQARYGAVNSIIQGLRLGRHLPEGASESALQEARFAAQAGVELSELLLTRRIGQVVLWNWILETVVRVVPEGPRQVAVLKQAAEYQFAWNDLVTHDVVAVYEREKAAFFFRSRDRERRAIVSDLLKGVPTDVENLGYNLRLSHLAVVAWGREPESALQALARLLDASLLVVEGAGDTSLAWLGSSQIGEWPDIDLTSVKPPAATYLAFGGPSAGGDGFCLVHRQAWQAYRVGRLRPRPVTLYRDVALESLVLRDLRAAQDFMAAELGPLGDDDERTKILRETLEAYFDTGQNAAATAAQIHVHQRTVAYRLKSIEERLGYSINRRRDELAFALRLADLLNDASRSRSDPDEGVPREIGL